MEDRQQSVILRIGSDYYSLTPAEKRLADYILANQERVVRQSISELAQQSGVAEATISRFSRHMGYKSFPLLKLAVANAMAQARLEPWHCRLHGCPETCAILPTAEPAD